MSVIQETEIAGGPEQIDVPSMKVLAKVYAEELNNPCLTLHIRKCLDSLAALPDLQGVALLVLGAQHLSIYAFTEVNRNSPRSKSTVASVGKICSMLDDVLRRKDPNLSSSLSYINTRYASVDSLMPRLKERWSADDSVSLITFANFV